MRLWRISQEENSNYDTYDSAVIAAETWKKAQRTHPQDYYRWDDKQKFWRQREGNLERSKYHGWADNIDNVKVELIGEAVEGIPAGVICASFNAG